MEPWEQEWYYTRALQRRQAFRPRCRVCEEILEEIDDLLYAGVCPWCRSSKEDE